MSLRINTNVDALTAYRNLTSTQTSMSTSVATRMKSSQALTTRSRIAARPCSITPSSANSCGDGILRTYHAGMVRCLPSPSP